MSNYNEEFPRYVKTAGKITVLTAFIGLFVFLVAFIFDVGTKEFSKVSAQTATTTLTVLNTPPTFAINAFESPDSSTTTPTNSGDDVTWEAVGVDSNDAPYFLLVCSTDASPTPQAAADINSLGTAPPECGAGAIQWGVSAAASSGDPVTVSTTTTETAPFNESNDWYAWVCDDYPFNPRCNNVPVQGPTSTTASSSPFIVNSRPTFSDFANDGPVDPGGVLNFFSTSSDPDTVGGADDIFLVVCQTNSAYNPVTNTCDTNFLASSTPGITVDATSTYALAAIVRDDTYEAYGYIVDEHGHEATTNPLQANFDVNNVPPEVLSGEIELYGNAGPGSDLVVDVPGGETPSSTLNFTIRDANSCVNAASGDEIIDFVASVFRSGIGTTTCDGSAGSYNPNNCYPSGVDTSVWALNCTATTTCSGPLQDNIEYSCDFPLWFVADPTDNNPGFTPASLIAQNWTAAVAGVDDDFATGTLATTSNPRELISFSAIDIVAAEIAYGGVEPGDDTGTLSATSTAQNVGNTGLDQEVRGESMCSTFTPSSTCPTSATSTIPDNQQQFASTSLPYNSPSAFVLSSTTDQEVELNIPETTATSSSLWAEGTTYWGIAVPASITLAGNYLGLNTFTARTAEDIDW